MTKRVIFAATASVTIAIAADDKIKGFLAQADGKADGNSLLAPFTESFYHMALVPLCAVTLVLAWYTRPKSGSEPLPPGFVEHQWKYLAVWAPAIMADWFQGPYVYALYASYGFSGSEIAELFVAGFGASMVFGTLVGSLSDSWGRKRCAVLYCVLYIVSCMTKHSSNYAWLMLGRVTGGIATSLLFSTFECWMVAEHCGRRGFSGNLLRYMFGCMFFVMYLTAIIAGVVAQAAADSVPLTSGLAGYETLHYGGYTAPFDLSILVLVGTIPLICFLWEENYGDANNTGGVMQSLSSAIQVMRSSWKICAVGLIVSCFEGSMFAFVFNWTPALDSKEVPPPYGLIFSAFMMACMCGSSIFSLIDSNTHPTKILLPVFALSAAALMLSNYFCGTSHLGLVFGGFLLFEFCIGIYFPTIGSLKSEIVPEEARAGVYNIFRVPLNAVVVGLLLTNLSTKAALGFCCVLITLATLTVAPMAWESQAPKEIEKAK